MKLKYDLGFPLALTLLTVLGFWLLPVRPAILGEDGFLNSIHDFIGLLAAFFVAALAAVSTFDRPSLDEPMTGTPPRLGKTDLTRRRFVCYLFGYLAVLSFFLFLLSIVAEIVAPSLRVKLSPTNLGWARTILGGIFALMFWNMVTTTMLGIWFLVERVHLDEPKNGSSNGPKPTEVSAIKRRVA